MCSGFFRLKKKTMRTLGQRKPLYLLEGGKNVSIELKAEYDKIYRYCYFKVHNSYVAEDLTQEAFLRYFSQSTYISRGKKLAYLYTIARNLCVDYYGRREKREWLGYEADENKDEGKLVNAGVQERDEMEAVENRTAVEWAVGRLPENLRELILLRYVNELSVTETGTVLGLSRFAVYRREQEALKKLRQLLGEEARI